MTETITPASEPLAALEDIAYYRDNFLNPSLWRPYVLEVCRRHGLSPALPLQTGLAGTYPVFIAGGRWVVKFFGRLFDGSNSFEDEYELMNRLGAIPDLPVPAVIARGELFPGGAPWAWPYLVLEYLPGVSFGEIGSILGRRVRMQLAGELGRLARRIHSLPAHGWDPYLEFLAEQQAACQARLETWGWMPGYLLDELKDYLLPPEALVDPGEEPHWIHADITRDHLLGRWEHGNWTTLGLIDWGDGRVGSLYFELIALHLDFFDGDATLLAVFLDGYGYQHPQNAAFACKALTAALLHPLDVLGPVWERHFCQQLPASLTELAIRLWCHGPVTEKNEPRRSKER